MIGKIVKVDNFDSMDSFIKNRAKRALGMVCKSVSDDGGLEWAEVLWLGGARHVLKEMWLQGDLKIVDKNVCKKY